MLKNLQTEQARLKLIWNKLFYRMKLVKEKNFSIENDKSKESIIVVCLFI